MGEKPQELVIVPSDGEGYVELARTRTGRLFRKHILNKGELIHPASKQKIDIDDKFVDTLIENFNNSVCDIVQVPLAGDKNEHTEAPDRNIGEVIGLESSDNKVYAIIDARDDDNAAKLGKTLLGASAMLHMDYTDTKSGKKVGPTLLHTCVTNRPYITNLEPYQEIVAATSDTKEEPILLTPVVINPITEKTTGTEGKPGEETEMTEKTPKSSLEELLTALKNDHNIDVASLQAKAAEGDQAASLSKTLVDALTASGVVKLSNTAAEQPSTEDVVGAVAELAQNNVALSNRVNALEKADAEHAVDALIAEGRVMPKQRDGFVELKLTNSSMFDALVPAEPIIKLTQETGVTPPDNTAQDKDIDAEVKRLVAMLPSAGKK